MREKCRQATGIIKCMDGNIIPSLSDAVGLFPLPNAILLPGATLPLHIHERRYRHLVRDAMDDNALMAMAFLLPGYEPYYHTLLARIHPVVCLGLIRDCYQTEDGRFFINLVGICRARVLDEDRSGDYRRAWLEPAPLAASSLHKDGHFAAAQLCRQMLDSPAFDGLEAAQKLRKACGNSISLEQLVDLLASGLLPAEGVEIKQLILSEPDILQRADVLLTELQVLAKSIQVNRALHDEAPNPSVLN